MKKFFQIPLKDKSYKGGLSISLAKDVLLKESHLVDYLNENKALRFRYNRKSNMLELWAKEKRLIMGQLMYPKMFNERGRIGLWTCIFHIYSINKLIWQKVVHNEVWIL